MDRILKNNGEEDIMDDNFSYLLNDVLRIMIEANLFNNISDENKELFFTRLLNIIEENHCNKKEVLEDIGQEIGICYCCFKVKKVFEYGKCIDCSIQENQYKIGRLLDKYQSKGNLITLHDNTLEKQQSRVYYDELEEWDTLEMGLACYKKDYTMSNFPKRSIAGTEIYLARFLAILLETKTESQTLEIFRSKGFSHPDMMTRRLYEDVDMGDNSKTTFLKVNNLLRFNKFWSYVDILNIHIIEDDMKVK